MKQYLDLLADVLDDGTDKGDRTGTGTRSQFGRQIRMDMSVGFPLLTTKRVFWKGVVAELLWFIAGDTNAKTLQDQGVTIWDEWADEDGELGPIYGKQWRAWVHHEVDDDGVDSRTIDQLQGVLEVLRLDPDSRRLVISAWNVGDLPDMKLAPCHCLFQFNTRPLALFERLKLLAERVEHFELDDLVPGLKDLSTKQGEVALHEALDKDGIPRRYLDLQLYQRSADIFLGVPFNIASYALLLHLVARHVGMVPGDFVHTFGDLHLYHNHCEQAETQLARRPEALPRLRFAEGAPTSIFEIRPEHLLLDGYTPAPAIKAPVAV